MATVTADHLAGLSIQEVTRRTEFSESTLMRVWQVSYLEAAADEMDSLPPVEQVAIQHAVEKLEVAGVRPPAPHCAPVKGVDGSRWELRPRRGNCPWRPIYTRIGADEFKIAAIAPDGETNPREFMRARRDAAERLAKWEEDQARR